MIDKSCTKSPNARLQETIRVFLLAGSRALVYNRIGDTEETPPLIFIHDANVALEDLQRIAVPGCLNFPDADEWLRHLWNAALRVCELIGSMDWQSIYTEPDDQPLKDALMDLDLMRIHLQAAEGFFQEEKS